jgi:hypothetical protein
MDDSSTRFIDANKVNPFISFENSFPHHSSQQKLTLKDLILKSETSAWEKRAIMLSY